MTHFFNTLTGKIEKLPSARGKRLNLFVCGPTVYDLAHIGHARTYIVFDMIVKYLRAQGYDVFYLQNITDIDDKIIERAQEEKTDPIEWARKVEKTYREDMKKLGITGVTAYARATDFIPQIIKQIWKLMRKGYAYGTRGGVYFDIAKFPPYGKLSHQNLKELRKAVRIEPDPHKKHDFDFALWKTSPHPEPSAKTAGQAKQGEPTWESPWGPGRPGWHIEDTAISEHFFGPQYDLHGGARDLIFPHHESEIAQMEAASGKKPFVKIWLHTGFLNVGGEKMSKSLGNFITIRDFLKEHTPEILRFLVFSAHYRSPIDYTTKTVEQARESLQRIVDFIERLKTIKQQNNKAIKQANKNILKKFEKKFEKALENDFDTPGALGILFGFITKTNGLLDKELFLQGDAKEILQFFKTWNNVFGVIPPQSAVPKKILELVAQRETLRKEKRWEDADEIRLKMQGLGWIVEDTPSGPRPKKVKN